MAEIADSLGPVATLITLVVGLVMLVMGRRLFWLLVGVIGFLIGLALAAALLQEQPDWILILAALIGGIMGALLAVFAQKIAVAVAGFMLGGYALIWLLQLAGLDSGQWQGLIYIAGGIVGAVLATSLFELALIVLSAMVGGLLIVQIPNFNAIVTALLFVAIVAAGIAIQMKNWHEVAR